MFCLTQSSRVAESAEIFRAAFGGVWVRALPEIGSGCVFCAFSCKAERMTAKAMVSLMVFMAICLIGGKSSQFVGKIPNFAENLK